MFTYGFQKCPVEVNSRQTISEHYILDAALLAAPKFKMVFSPMHHEGLIVDFGKLLVF